MINKNKAYRLRVLSILSELHYCHGIDFPFPFPLTYKALKKIDSKIQQRNTSASNTIFHKNPRPVERYIGVKRPQNLHVVSIWRQR